MSPLQTRLQPSAYPDAISLVDDGPCTLDTQLTFDRLNSPNPFPARGGGLSRAVHRTFAAQAYGRLAKLLDRIRDELNECWSVADIAREAGMSEQTLFRRFREAVGQSPGEWLNGLRLAEAKRLLETTGLPVGEVAYRSGFGSSTNLLYHLKLDAGMTSRQYRAIKRIKSA